VRVPNLSYTNVPFSAFFSQSNFTKFGKISSIIARWNFSYRNVIAHYEEPVNEKYYTPAED
jgi:hypothetical protein